MNAANIPLCIDCIHHSKPVFGDNYCRRLQKPSTVDGRMTGLLLCENERIDVSFIAKLFGVQETCGANGEYFQEIRKVENPSTNN